MDASRDVGFPLGVGAPPRDGAELVARVRSALNEGVAGFRVTSLADGAVSAVMDGFDIARFDAEVTGARLERDASGVLPAAPGESLTVGSGILHRLRIQGDPLEWAGAPVTVEIDIAEVPIRWCRRPDGVLELVADGVPSTVPGTPAHEPEVRPHGRGRVAVTEAAIPAVVAAATSLLAGTDIRMRDADLAFADAGTDAVGFGGSAQLAFSALRARIEIAGVVRIVGGRRLRVEGLELRSRNVLAAAALAAFRSKIDEATRADIDLAAHLPSEFSAAQLHISSSDGGLELTLEVP